MSDFKNFLTGLIILKYCDDKIRSNNKQKFILWRNKYHYANHFQPNGKCHFCYRKITGKHHNPKHRYCHTHYDYIVKDLACSKKDWFWYDECCSNKNHTKWFPLVKQCLALNIEDPHELCDPYDLRKMFRSGNSSI